MKRKVISNKPNYFQDIRTCDECHKDGLLFRGAKPLFHESGNYQSEIIFILEAPNWDDSFKYGRITYDGETDPTGNFVNKCLRTYLNREEKDVYITNAVLCLPKQENRRYNVKPQQIINCSSRIKTIIKRINPTIVVTMGIPALKAIKQIENHSLPLNLSSVAKHIRWYGRILFPMAHPSLLGRLPQNRSGDLQKNDFKELARLIKEITHP